MQSFGSFLKRYPVVALTIVVLALTVILLLTGNAGPAQWIASGYVVAFVVWTSIGMLLDILRGHWGLDILAVVAMVAAVAVGEYLAATIIVLMLSGGEALEDFAANRAKRELTALLDRAPQVAHRIVAGTSSSSGSNDTAGAAASLGTDDDTVDVTADEIAAGDVLLVKPAEVVPVDGELLDAEASFDESSLTGESLPVTHRTGDRVMSGSVNGTRAVRMRATATAANSQYQRIVALVAEAEQQKAPTVRVADRFAVPFTLLSLAIAGVAWWLSGDPVRFAEVLVLATPCPLLIAAPVAFMGGLSNAARKGVIVKGGATLEALAGAKSIAFDKTGTLSHGEPELVRVLPANGLAADELLRLAASAERASSHVLARGIVLAATERGLAVRTPADATEVATNGVSATVDGRRVIVGKLRFVQQTDPTAHAVELAPGETSVAVAVDGRFAGTLLLADGLRANAPATIRALHGLGVRDAVMLTGDNGATAAHLASEAGIDTVHASLLPDDKVRLLQGLPDRPVIMVGDGVNDAPVLAVADVGIAMGARGSTAASESADVVIVKDDISRVAQAVGIGRHTFRVALTAIWIGIILSVGLMVVAAFGFIPAVAGALTQELVDLACILYALLALRGGHVDVPTAPAASDERAPVLAH